MRTRNDATVQQSKGCTLKDYSKAKKLPLEFLECLDLSEITYNKSSLYEKVKQAKYGGTDFKCST